MKFKLLFKYRSVYMFMAMAMLVLYHSPPWWPEGALRQLVSYFYGAVDIFIFCSGIGCWFSYDKDQDALAFIKRRAIRIMPVFLIFWCQWIWLNGGFSQVSVLDAISALFMVQYLTGRAPVLNWYYSFMLVSYLLTPALYRLVQKTDTRLKAGLATAGLLFISFMFWNQDEFVIILTRLPLFFVGMLFAAESRSRESLNRKEIGLLFLLMPIGLLLLRAFNIRWPDQLWGWGLYWSPFLLITPGFCVGIGLAASLLERVKPGRAILAACSFAGGFSFEFFVTHDKGGTTGFLQYLGRTALEIGMLHIASLLVRKAILAVASLYGRRKERASIT